MARTGASAATWPGSSSGKRLRSSLPGSTPSRLPTPRPFWCPTKSLAWSVSGSGSGSIAHRKGACGMLVLGLSGQFSDEDTDLTPTMEGASLYEDAFRDAAEDAFHDAAA